MAEMVDYKKKYNALMRKVRKFVKANNAMVDFMDAHLMDLADEQVAEYEELKDAVGKVSL